MGVVPVTVVGKSLRLLDIQGHLYQAQSGHFLAHLRDEWKENVLPVVLVPSLVQRIVASLSNKYDIPENILAWVYIRPDHEARNLKTMHP